MGIFTGLGVLVGLLFKLWMIFRDRKTAQDVAVTADKKVEEAHADDKAAAVEVAKAEARVEVEAEKIDTIVAATEPESEERIEELTDNLAAMTRRRHAEGSKTP